MADSTVGTTMKYGVAIGVGIAIGALGVLLLKRDKTTIRGFATDVISHGIDFKDKAMTFVEGAKEAMSDLVAEAEAKQKQRNQEDA